MSKPTTEEIREAVVPHATSEQQSRRVAAAAMGVIDRSWAEEEAERERGRKALEIVESYADHRTSCRRRTHVVFDPCTCGLDEALASLRNPVRTVDDPPSSQEFPAPAVEGAGAVLHSPLTDGVLMNASDSAQWNDERVEHFNREQRTKRAAFLEALESVEVVYCGGRSKEEFAAARYPLKKRVPRVLKDPHAECWWRVRSSESASFEDAFEVSFHGMAPGSWRLAGDHTAMLTWTQARVRALSELLDAPYAWQDSTEIEEAP